MPRRGPLLALSREHHGSLVLARDCRRATQGDVAQLRRRIAAHHRDVLIAHFAAEEALLAIHAGAIPALFHERMNADHAWLRDRVNAADVAAIVGCGDRLAAHVRFQERALWPLLQPLVDPG